MTKSGKERERGEREREIGLVFVYERRGKGEKKGEKRNILKDEKKEKGKRERERDIQSFQSHPRRS